MDLEDWNWETSCERVGSLFSRHGSLAVMIKPGLRVAVWRS